MAMERAGETGRRRLRATGVYALFVVVPAVVAIVLLAGLIRDPVGSSSIGTVTGHPLARLLLAVAVVVAACKAVGWLARRLRQPPVLGEIVAGILLGPSVLGAVWPGGAAALLPSSVLPELNVLAQLGIILFVFLTGLELNTSLLRGRGQLAVVVSHVSIVMPFLLG